MKPDTSSIGKTFFLEMKTPNGANTFQVKVKVVNTKLTKHFGNFFLLVEPLEGQGSLWVKQKSLKVIK